MMTDNNAPKPTGAEKTSAISTKIKNSSFASGTKTAAGLLFAVYGLCATIMAAIGFAVDLGSKSPNQAVSEIGKTLRAKNRNDTGACFYVDRDVEQRILFQSPETAFVVEAIKIAMPFVKSNIKTKELGSLPLFRSANCDAIKDDLRLTWLQAQTKSNEALLSFMQTDRMVKFQQEQNSGLYKQDIVYIQR